MGEKTKRILRQGAMLSLCALLLRLVGVSFNAYLKAALGEGGMGLISLTLSVYGFAVTLATGGVSLSVTRLLAEALGCGRPDRACGVLRAAFGYATLFGSAAGVALLALSHPLAVQLLGDIRTLPALRLLALGLLPMALSAVFSGYFTALRRPGHNAATQIGETGLRILLTTSALSVLLPRGLEYACLAVVGGSCLSEVGSCLGLLVQYRLDRRRHPLPPPRPGENQLRPLVSVALPTAAAAWCRSGLLTAQHLLIPLCLTMGSMPREEALAAYAALHGMALPVVLLPTALLASFAGLLVPEVAGSHAAGHLGEVKRAAAKALVGTLLLATAASVVFTLLGPGLGMAVYGSPRVGRYIRLLAPLVPVMYMDSATDAVLKGLGHQVYCMGVNIGDAALCVLLVRLLLPRFGPEGYIAVIYITELYNFALSFGKLCIRLRPRGRPQKPGECLALP